MACSDLTERLRAVFRNLPGRNPYTEKLSVSDSAALDIKKARGKQHEENPTMLLVDNYRGGLRYQKKVPIE